MTSSVPEGERLDAVLVASLVVVHAWLVLEPAYFLQDDFLNFLQVVESYRSPFQFLARPDFGRFAPTHRAQHALLWVLGGGAPSWPVARAFLAVLQASSAVLVMRVCRPWTSRTWALIASLGWGLSLAPTFATGWLAASLHVTTALVGCLWGLACAQRYLRSGRRWSLLGAAIAWLLALGAYEKTIVLVPALWLLEALVQRPASWRRWLVSAGCFGALAAAFLAIAWSRGMSQPGALLRVELVEGLWNAAWRGWPELLLGVSFPLLGWALTLVLVLGTLIGAESRGRVLGLWLVLLALAVMIVTPAAAKRIDELGAGWGSERRYFMEWWLLFLLVSGVTIARARASVRQALTGGVGMVFVVLAPGHHLVARRTVEALHPPEVRQWVEHARVAVGTPVEAEVPAFVVSPWYWPYSSAPRLLRAFGQVRTGDVLAFDETGRAVPMEWQAEEPLPLVEALTENSCAFVREERSSCFRPREGSCWLRWVPPSPKGALRAVVTVADRACVDWVLEPSNGFGVDGVPRCEPIRGELGFQERAPRADCGGLVLRSLDVHLRAGGQLCLEAFERGRWIPKR